MPIFTTAKKIGTYLWSTRISGVLLAYVSIFQLIFLAYFANLTYFPLTVLFFLALFATTFYTIISVANSWNYKTPKIYQILKGYEPIIATLIPTYGEPITMIKKTINSILEQNYPQNKMVLVISDDAHSSELEEEIKRFQDRTTAHIFYHHPPKKDALTRLGEAKAGNLNSALYFILKKYPKLEYIETRDADDIVGDPNFLRFCIGSLIKDDNSAFVQTIKRTIVSENDPFFNQEEFFYERVMPARASDNAVFPCGSGLVWKRSALLKLSGFPSWNLVEDLQSGYEILKRQKRGLYLPIVGAIGQIAPEDIPNFYKQRGTWAIDSLRLLFWDNPLFARYLSMKQRLHFFDLCFSYLLSIPMFIFYVTIMSCLNRNICPVTNIPASFIGLNIIFILIFELQSILKAGGIPYKTIWKGRQNWLGLAPVFAISAIKALLYGPNKKPAYKVTRKSHHYAIYWSETLVQQSMVLTLVITLIIKLIHYSTIKIFDLILIYWALFFIFGLHKVIVNSWHGVEFKQIFTAFLRDKSHPKIRLAYS